MTEERAKRKLSAILSADVKGYSRLMGEDELATVRTLKTYREMIAEVIRNYSGRVVDSPGDNVLAEFASVVDAVESAVKIQKELKAKNADLPENRRMEFRIGINLGDIIEEGERIYGDGVNIAARIESLAKAGEICIASNVYEQVKKKLTFGYKYLGKHSVKNIDEPMQIYRILLEHRDSVDRKREKLKLPDKPSIAVLPFLNMSGDPEQEYFSDGLTEDLITDLSKISGLFVIARNSVFTYKGKAMKIQEVGQELGVRYVLEGSVRKANSQVRITAQLVDAETSHHLWAERYDHELEDIFALQDHVTQKIVSVLAVKLREGEQKRLAERHTNNVMAYDSFLRGLEHFNQYTKEGIDEARKIFEKAIKQDPEFALAYAKLGWTYLTGWMMGWSQNTQSLDRALELAQKATSLNEELLETNCLMGYVYLWKKQHEKAIALYEKVVDLNPNFADGYADLGGILNFAGRPEKAIGLIDKAMRLDPLPPVYHLFHLGHAHFLMYRYDEAIATLRGALKSNSDFFPARAFLAVTYIELGHEDEARAEVAEIFRRSPETTLEIWQKTLPYKNQELTKRILNALRKAGLK